MKRFLLCLSLLFALLLTITPSQSYAAPELQSGCLFFTETGNGQGGYSVCDDAQASFRTAFQRWGLQQIGYPISRRYERDGFVTQAFQKAVMQWRPESNSVVLVNIFDDLNRAGFDQRLLETRQTPHQFPAGWDGEGLTFAQVVQKRQALLDARPALRTTYFSAGDPLTFFGLPTSEVTDMGNHYAIRLQRAVLQEWKEDVPWARAGQVTIANGGSIARELGALPGEALTPEPQAGGSTPPAPNPAPAPTQPPAPTAPVFSKEVPLGQEFQVPHWGIKLYDVKRAKALYYFDNVTIAHGTYLVPLVEFRNTGSGTAKPSSNLDFYLQDAAGRTYDLSILYTETYAILGASWQFQAGHIYDAIHPGSVLGIALPTDISPSVGDIWLRVEQAPNVVIYLGNVGQMPELQ